MSRMSSVGAIKQGKLVGTVASWPTAPAASLTIFTKSMGVQSVNDAPSGCRRSEMSEQSPSGWAEALAVIVFVVLMLGAIGVPQSLLAALADVIRAWKKP